MDLVDRIRIFLKRFDYPETTHSFGLFRILFFAHGLRYAIDILLNKDMLLFQFQLDQTEVLPFDLLIKLWITTSLFMMLGLFVRYTSIAHYILTVLVCQVMVNIKIATFYNDLLLMGGLLCIVVPVGRSFSMDNLIRKFYNQQIPQTTGKLNYLLFIFLTLGLLYFASAFTKLTSKMWLTGIGVWLPLNFPLYTNNDLFKLVIDQKELMYVLNYLVIIWELVFIVLLFSRRFRWIIILLGVGFHIVIGLLYPFNYISFGPVLFYLLFIPGSFWKKCYGWFSKPFEPSDAQRQIHFLQQRYFPLTTTDKQNLIIIFSLVMLGSQVYLICIHSIHSLRKFNDVSFVRSYENELPEVTHKSKPLNTGRALFGLSSRGLFIDVHFSRFIPAYAVSYIDDKGNSGWLPLVDTKGHVNTELNTYLMWHRYTFSFFAKGNGPIREHAVEKITRYWAENNGINLNNLKMRLLSRNYHYSYTFEPGMWKRMEQTPWFTVGTMTWKDSVFTYFPRTPSIKR